MLLRENIDWFCIWREIPSEVLLEKAVPNMIIVKSLDLWFPSRSPRSHSRDFPLAIKLSVFLCKEKREATNRNTLDVPHCWGKCFIMVLTIIVNIFFSLISLGLYHPAISSAYNWSWKPICTWSLYFSQVIWQISLYHLHRVLVFSFVAFLHFFFFSRRN